MSLLVKRPAPEPDSTTSPKSSKGGGGGSFGTATANEGEEKSPVPRPPSHKQITICVKQRSWEEILSTHLQYLPLSQSIMSLMDSENLNTIYRFYNSSNAFTINKVSARASNFIILNDQLGSSADPVEISSVVQRAKIIHWIGNVPNTIGFKIRNLSNNQLIGFYAPPTAVDNPVANPSPRRDFV